jgi:HD-GYP domain-containing protein (c-di-GMP phosphodiesterase class II)
VAGEKIELYTPGDQSDGYLPMLKNSFDRILAGGGDPEEMLRECARRGTVATEHILAHATSEGSHDCAQAFVGTLVQIFEESALRFASTADILGSHPKLAEHSVRVSLQGLLLARAAEISDPEELGVGLLLHDVGVLELEPDDFEPSADSQGDRARQERYQQHPLLGARLLSQAPWWTTRIRDVVQNHHERLDGSGTPRGLAADEISPSARIAGIVDTFDRRVTGRGGVEPMGTFDVLQGMLEEEGLYDEKLLRSFVGLMAG